ncbi:hypothetical protein HN018_21945 (plasmid) [Lichenicola cladoniae]|uniref:Uncharacterized protein n=1 Tax=Lichenicola cladoniae TaxID=1484109 RepID=A0A6M8HWV9_9PROT|nr:hypothetical protein [Lichenicola cladoniae]QKE92892.1 hypothetical protein HN018_21945 [Lichenicola cladoniae]
MNQIAGQYKVLKGALRHLDIQPTSRLVERRHVAALPTSAGPAQQRRIRLGTPG